METIFIEKAFDYMWTTAPRSSGERSLLALTLVVIGIFLLLFGGDRIHIFSEMSNAVKLYSP
jgi:hypothetical protein